ncbi:MAG TPA: ABC transporter substrate-binding protein [Pyrinomonadaceae bacterium]|jgi:branched-chain amino acid transport system substrate-binding protein
MKQINSLLFIITLLIFVSCNGNQQGNSNENQSVKIGAVLPLTGGAAQYGAYFKQGSELAFADAIEEGLIKDGQARLLIEDGKGDATTSLSAFKKLVDTEKISASLIDLSNVILAIKPEANRNSIVSINSSSFSSEIEDANDFMFSVLPNAKQYGEYIGDFCFNNLKYRTAGVIYRNDPMGVSFNSNFKGAFGKFGGNVVFEESHPVGETNFKTIIEKIRDKKVDMVLFASYAPEIANFAKQCKETNCNVQIVTYQGFLIKDSIAIAQDAANGIIVIASSFDPASSDPKIAKLREQLKAKYNSDDLNYYTAAHYDGTRILLEAVASGAKSGNEIRDFIIKKKTFNGLTGQITFDENGLAQIPLVPYKVENQNFVLVK